VLVQSKQAIKKVVLNKNARVWIDSSKTDACIIAEKLTKMFGDRNGMV
jgi:hypothetical protein